MTVDGARGYICIGTVNCNDGLNRVAAGVGSTDNLVSNILSQPQGIVIVDQQMHVTVSSYRAIVEGVVLVEVTERVDPGIAGTRSSTRSVVGDDTEVEGVVRGVIFKADSVVSLNAVLNRERVECVPARSRGFEWASKGPSRINGKVNDRTVGCRNHPKPEGAVGQTSA